MVRAGGREFLQKKERPLIHDAMNASHPKSLPNDNRRSAFTFRVAAIEHRRCTDNCTYGPLLDIFCSKTCDEGTRGACFGARLLVYDTHDGLCAPYATLCFG